MLTTMKQRPPPPLLVAAFFFPLLASSSNPRCPSSCPGIRNISYPFGAAKGCGAPGFLLNCSSYLSTWRLELHQPDMHGIAAPVYIVLGIDSEIDNYGSSGVLNFTCVTESYLEEYRNTCIAFPLDSLFALAKTDLSSFTYAKLTFSESNMLLLLGCKDRDTLAGKDYCRLFRKVCGAGLSSENEIEFPMSSSCVEFQPWSEPASDYDDLEKEFYALNATQCQGYRSFVTRKSMTVDDSRADASSIFQLGFQLNWTIQDSMCAPCQRSEGTCGYNVTDGSFLCFCDDDKSSVTDCSPRGASSKGRSLVLLLLIVLATIAVVIAVLGVYVVRRRKKSSLQSVPSDSSSNFVTERGKSFASRFGSVATREFSFKELDQATDSFSDDRLLGDGGFGAVYEGRLYNGRKVAVKRLYHDNFRRMEQFFNEIRILSSLAHSNMVKLYGYCCEDERDLLLVFEYVSNGTLAYHLYDPRVDPLPWKIRLKIAWETAQALSYLHYSVTPPVYHRDVKSHNILLDQDFHVKLADFGLSRLVPLQASHVSTTPQGTPGYLDPDYRHCYQLTDKSDVYSFGVVLVELVSALQAVDMSRKRGEINLSALAVSKIVCGAWQQLLDPRLEIHREPHVEDMARRVMELAFRCLAEEKENRPDTKEVVKELANIWESGYGKLNSQFSINISFTTSGTSPLIKHKAELSPTSVQSPYWTTSSTVSCQSSGFSPSSRGSA